MGIFDGFRKRTAKVQASPPMREHLPYTQWQVGDIVKNRYQVYRILGGPGKSGMGIVYICYDHEMREAVAVKTFQGQYIGSRSAIERFKREAEAWVSLERHPNIVTAKMVDLIDRIPYIFLEYVVGDDKYGADLNGWIHRGGLNLALALNFDIQFCRGMIHAQRKFNDTGKHFVHRDIKPTNIMVTCDKIVKVTDFGLVKASLESMADTPLAKSSNSSNSGLSLSKSGAIWGTPPYMSPEQCLGSEEIDTRSDIYSFGCVMYEMLTRKPVFEGSSFDEYIYKHLSVTPESPKCHDEVDSIILRCLEKDPSNRYQDFVELEQILSQLYHKFTGEVVHTPEARELDTWDLSNKGLSLVRLGLYKEAELCLQEALRANPNNSAAHHNLAISYYKLGRFDDATREYEQALKIEPSAYRVLFDLAMLYQNQGKLDDAIATYQKSLTINKNYVDAYNMLGTAYGDYGKFDDAILQYKEALRINPNDAGTHLNLGSAFESLGRLDEAIKEYKEAIRITPNYWEAYYNLGAFYQVHGKLDDAMREYMQVLRVNPDTPLGYLGLGNVYQIQGNLNKAIESYRESLNKDPKYWPAHHNLGIAYAAQGNLAKAIEEYTEALRINPNEADVHKNLGLAYEAQGKHAEAMKHFRESLRINPHHANAEYCRQRLHSSR